MRDRQVMNWRRAQRRRKVERASIQRRSGGRRRRRPHPRYLSPLPCFLSPSLSLPSLAPSLEQTLWRRRRDVSPFTAALEPALAAPLRRFPWTRGFGLVSERRFSADQPGDRTGHLGHFLFGENCRTRLQIRATCVSLTGPIN